jgi:transposase-like protein
MTTTSQHQAYQPSGDELLIFEFAKMQGKTQSEVARMFGINQSTVSRIIQRIERWQAHAKARENGRLDPRERLRAQRWLTYERNELILASCLRIAHEMEGFTELSKSTICRPVDSPSQKHQIRTEGRTIDRHGVAARFLRLAWRINMDQLKLTDLLAREDDALAEPLTEDELATEAHQAALDAAELAAAQDNAAQAATRDRGLEEWDGATNVGCVQSPLGHHPAEPPASSPQPPAPAVVHNPHKQSVLEIVTNPAAPCTCRLQTDLAKNSPHTCIADCDQPSQVADEADSDVRPSLAST